MFKAWFATPLWARVLLALILGAIVGYFWGEDAECQGVSLLPGVDATFFAPPPKRDLLPLIFYCCLVPYR